MNEKLLQSDLETIRHINAVRDNISLLVFELLERAKRHDESKLASPEREIFGAHHDELGKVEYGSQEYKDLLEKVKPAILNHYSKNRHHPEHFSKGMDEMDLIDVLEMICDWTAATSRNKNGNIHRSIEINSEKYGIPPMLASILSNTVNRYF